MAKFIINGGKKLKGEVRVLGSKNAATACLAASLLIRDDLVLENVPNISDVEKMKKILQKIGVRVASEGKKHRVVLNSAGARSSDLNFPEVFKIRSSILLVGPILARFGKVKILHPGGCHIGARPITTHLDAFQDLGVRVRKIKDYYYLEGKGLRAGEVVLSEFSVTATENIMIAACLLPGKTKIKLAAAEPHVQDLARLLNRAGAKIRGAGSHTITIEGVSKLKGTRHRVIPDMIEAGTFIIASLLIGGGVKIVNIDLDHLDLFLKKVEQAGGRFDKGKSWISVLPTKVFGPVQIQTLPYPGFPTDLQAPFSVLLTQSRGESLIHDPMYEGRLKHLEELKKMGARVKIISSHKAVIRGPVELKGREIMSFDLRAGATLILAALVASGKSVIHRAEEVDRGYERIEERLSALGADIRRVD